MLSDQFRYAVLDFFLSQTIANRKFAPVRMFTATEHAFLTTCAWMKGAGFDIFFHGDYRTLHDTTYAAPEVALSNQ